MHEELSPNVSFTDDVTIHFEDGSVVELKDLYHDKVAIHFKDGSIVELKHLYHDDSALRDICWADVVDCHEI